MRTRRSILFACTAVVVTMAAACGDDDDDNTVVVTPSPTLPPPDAGRDAADAAAPVDAAVPVPDAAPPPPPPPPPPPGASFTQVYTTVIATSCAPCHTTAGGIGITTGNLDMTTQANAFANLVNVAAGGGSCAGEGTRVVPRSSATSLLFLKVDPAVPAPCGSKMPLGLAPLSQDQVNLINSWITAGALDN